MDEEVTRKLLIEIQDYLAPQLDSYEQMLYHYFFRHSHVEGKSTTVTGTRTLQTRVGLGVGQAGSPPSQRVVMKKLRSLEKKGCIEILSRSSRGTEVRVFLPREIPGVVPEKPVTSETPIGDLDFYNVPELRLCLLRRENHLCFYCRRKISEGDYTVDHVCPQAEGGRDGYANVVACCFECNSRKQAKDGKAFLLLNYREEMLNAEEYQGRLVQLETLLNGELKPDV